PAADAGDGGPLGGLHTDDLDGGVLFLQVAGGAHDGTGGAHGADEMGDGPRRVAPDLGAGALVVGARVVGVGELVQHLALALRLHGLGQVARALHARLAAHQDDL